MSHPLRVLLVSGEYPPMQGGVADFTRLLAEAMLDQGADVQVLTSTEAGEGTHTRFNAPRVPCHARMRSWGWRPLYLSARALCRELRPDVVDIQYQTAAYNMHPAINFLPAMLGDLVSVATFHDIKVPYLFPKAGSLRPWVNLQLARRSRATIVTNAQDRAVLARYGGIRRLELIPIGSNISDATPPDYERSVWRARWGVGGDTILLCYFGFLNASKGGEDLAEALHILVNRGWNAVLLMIGGAVGASDPTNRGYLEVVKGLLRQRGLEKRVIWTEHMPPEQVSACFHSADICVLPYRDGASFRRGSIMAALAHGMPIVTTRPEVPLDELRDGDNALLVPPRDPEAVASAVARLAGDVDLRKRLGSGAKVLSLRFSWPDIAARTLEVCHAVAGR